MKKCPVCEKTFDDSMRFCQTDGTPLDELIEQTPDDPFKTMVARPDDLFPAPPLPPDDPFKTMVAGSQPKDVSGDLLQLPEEFDSMKTAVVSPEEMREHLSADNPADAPSPPSPFADADSPLELGADKNSDVLFSTPSDIPRFNEPSLNPPDFGNMPSPTDSSENVTEIIPPQSLPPGNPFSFDSNPVPPQSPPPMAFGDSPFNSPNDAPIPSPFDDAPKSYDKPSTPMPSYKEPEPPTILGSNPFDQPPTFGQQQDPFNQPFNPSAPQNDWAPPPAPVSNWQDQGLGANTPFQTPRAGGQGQNQILPIVSLALGIVSICCPIGVLTGPAAIITGFLGMKNVDSDPAQYGGKGVAIAGMITGGVFFLLSIVWWILRLLGLAFWSMGGFN